ncbi:MAG: glycosyltransferase family 25 protein [Thermodesulfobacteriota bacterium]
MNDNRFVLHVKTGYPERELSILDQFSRLRLPFQWVLEHDIPEISQDVLRKYKYHGSLRDQEISCCLKHIAAWERIAAGNHAGGFVFEDDVLIDLRRFKTVTEAALEEFQARFPAGDGCLCFGNGCCLYVPWTKTKQGTILYPAEYVRAADSYWLSRKSAQRMVERIKQAGFEKPADHLIDVLCSELGIPICWSAPAVVSQGSHTGLFPSSIQTQETGSRIGKEIEWLFKRVRRKYLYPLVGVDLTRK